MDGMDACKKCGRIVPYRALDLKNCCNDLAACRIRRQEKAMARRNQKKPKE